MAFIVSLLYLIGISHNVLAEPEPPTGGKTHIDLLCAIVPFAILLKIIYVFIELPIKNLPST